MRALREQIDKMLYERTAIAKLSEFEIRKQLQTLTIKNVTNPDLVFKNTYVLDFLNLPQVYSESDLEQALVRCMEQFILELGNGFAFLERQKRITVDGEDYHLDLLFFHRKLKRLVAIDLKLGKFKPAYKGQMELYLRWLEKHEMQTGLIKSLARKKTALNAISPLKPPQCCKSLPIENETELFDPLKPIRTCHSLAGKFQ